MHASEEKSTQFLCLLISEPFKRPRRITVCQGRIMGSLTTPCPWQLRGRHLVTRLHFRWLAQPHATFCWRWSWHVWLWWPLSSRAQPNAHPNAVRRQSSHSVPNVGSGEFWRESVWLMPHLLLCVFVVKSWFVPYINSNVSDEVGRIKLEQCKKSYIWNFY